MDSISRDQQIPRQGDNLRIIFLHHSTGRNLIRHGGVRDLIAKRSEREGTNYEFWDHDYNEIGLTGPSGERMDVSFDVPDDNTDPDGLDRLFSQPVHDPPDNALSRLLGFDVIIFKSCFPVSAIRSQSQLEQYQLHYRSIRKTMSEHPGNLFIVVTPPPLVARPFNQTILPSSEKWTNAADARRAREFSRWLVSQDFLDGLPNVATFDLFDHLAEPDTSRRQPNMLRAEYRSGRFGLDAHPNPVANRAIAPILVDTLFESINIFQQRTLRNESILMR